MKDNEQNIWAVSWTLRNLGVRSIIHAISLDSYTLCGCNIEGNESIEISQDIKSINCKVCLNRLINNGA